MKQPAENIESKSTVSSRKPSPMVLWSNATLTSFRPKPMQSAGGQRSPFDILMAALK
jgi:hypothetical protein